MYAMSGPIRVAELRGGPSSRVPLEGLWSICGDPRSGPSAGAVGTGWQTGQKYDDRFMNATRLIGARAAVARLVLAAVGVQRAVEVAGLAVDVDVERVERGAALPQRRDHHGPGVVEQLGDLGTGQPVAGPLAVQPGAPQRLVGVDVADARR